jgi:hypothetical protein
VKTNGPIGADVIQLRELLAERFPAMRSWTDNPSPKARAVWPTGLPQFDELTQGGLHKGSITEVVSAGCGKGSALFLRAILRQTHQSRQLVALIDGQDSFDPSALPQAILSRLLWARCQNADEALKAADIVLRDRNLPLVILDLKMNSTSQTRKISASTWHRLQRLAEAAETALLVLTARPLAGAADARLTLESWFGLEAMAQDEMTLVSELEFNLTHWALGGQAAAMAG